MQGPRTSGISRTLGEASQWLWAGLLLAACGADSTPPETRPCAVLLTLDATRTDALTCYGSPANVTPNLDLLSATGTTYDYAHTVAPLTMPAHASILTGLYPPRHGLRDITSAPLPPSAETLAELARDGGYETAAFVSAEGLGPKFGLDQGFEVFDGVETGLRPGRETVARASAWLAGRDAQRPFLLWVHLAEPLAPYEPPPEFRQGALASNPYQGEVAAMDREVGRLMAALGDAGVLERTTVLAVADHGEGLGQHDEVGHSYFCWESTLRVPFLLRSPAGPMASPADPLDPSDPDRPARAGLRSGEAVSVVDVLPTLAHALGLEYGRELDGVDLLAGPVDLKRGVYFESYAGYADFGWSPLAGWLDVEGKYVHARRPLFFRLATDPQETTDAATERPELVGPYAQKISEVCQRPVLARPPGAPPSEFPHPLEETGRPSPFDQLYERKLYLQAIDLFGANQLDQALEAFEAIAEANSGHRLAREMVAVSLMRLGRHSEAVEPWRQLLADHPGNAGASFNLGVCLSNGDQAAKQEAVEHIRRAIELDPFTPHFALQLQRLLEMLGRGTEAAAVPEAVRRLRAARRGE